MIVYDIQKVYKTYPGQKYPANKNICLQICRGEIFGLLGDNGAGKSTLIGQMVNLIESTSGEISLWGDPIARNPLSVPLSVGYMPQDARALGLLTVGEALYYTAHLRGLNRRGAGTECDRLLEMWQMGDLKNKYSIHLSGGQLRLLRLAVSIAGEPPVIVLDEPTNDLDPRLRKLVWETLRQLNKEKGTTIIFITHDALEAEKVIQRVGIMRAGELVAVGRPSELKQKLGQKLRLEIFFSPSSPPILPSNLYPHRIEPGRWLIYLKRDQVSYLTECLGQNRIHDFYLYSTTLEDLYIHYANEKPS